MTLRRILLSFLTLLVLWVVGQSLFASWNAPQVSNRLQLYQTDLLLESTAWQGSGLGEEDADVLRRTLFGEKPLEKALEDYTTVREETAANLVRSQALLTDTRTALALPLDQQAADPAIRKLQTAISQELQLLAELDVRLGILQAQEDKPDTALQTWSDLQQTYPASDPNVQAAEVLTGLWQEPPQLLPEAESQLQTYLEGWFRNRALEQLYTLQDRTTDRQALLAAERQAAEQTVVKLILVGILPTLGAFLGAVVLLGLVGQWALRGKDAILMRNAGRGWDTPWTAETVWQVLIVGFFFVGQLVLPLVLGALGIGFAGLTNRGRALFALVYYLLMAGSGLLVLYWSIRTYRPLPPDWFRFSLRRDNWIRWGLGGYLVALPLMIGVSVINQQFWQGQGGSNPLLQTVLEEQDPLALAIFFATAAIAAPLFEEFLFRGFLLPSLTRYMPVWGAILLSSLLFAAAHLSLSEVLPLTVLGIVLAFVYTRSRNLLAPMLLHSAWNSVTMVGLLLLGSATS